MSELPISTANTLGLQSCSIQFSKAVTNSNSTVPFCKTAFPVKGAKF